MLNQKGIVLTPLMIWAVIIVGSIFIAQDAVKQGYIQLDLPSSDQISDVSTSPSSEPTFIPIPTEEPTAIPTNYVEQKINTTQTTSNGSRTGRIIKYKEYCKGDQEISVYENELITKKVADGNTYSMTKTDWDCYSRDIATRPSNTQNYPPCIIYYPALGYSRTYNYTSPSACSYWQERVKATTQPLKLPEIKVVPLPIIEPYKPNNIVPNIDPNWQPTQFVAPTSKCYTTWDEYFKAHPNYGTNITGGSPPCD